MPLTGYKFPVYCYSCGVYLMGGATQHKPDCEILALILEMQSKVSKEPEVPEEEG